MAAWLWARSEWRRQWGSLALLALLVAVAGGVTIAAAAGARRADSAFARFTDQTGDPELTADAVDQRDWWDPDRMAEGAAAFEEAATVPGIVRAQLFAAFAVAVGESPDYFSFALVDEAGEPARPFFLEGRAPDLNDPGEAIVNEAGAELFGVGAGDELRLRTISSGRVDEYLSNPAFLEADGELTVRVVGVRREAFDIAQQDDPFVMLTPAFVREHAEKIANCACIHLFDAEAGRADEVLAGLRDVYEPYGFYVGLEEEGSLPEQVGKGIDVEVTAMWLLALAAGVAGLVVVAQAMARQVAEASAEHDTAAALGATTGQRTAAGALTLAPAVVAGGIGAVVLAVALSPLSPRGLARRAEVDPGVRVDPLAVGLGFVLVAALGGALIAVVARWSARRRHRDPTRLVALPRGLGPAGQLGVAFAIRPGRRGRGTTGAAVVATTIGVAGVLAVWSFDTGRQHLLHDGRLFGVDAGLAWRGLDADVPGVIAGARAEGGVEAVGVRWGVLDQGNGFALTTPGGSSSSFVTAFEGVVGWAGPTLVSGRLASAPDEVALGRHHLELLDADIGDELTVAGRHGSAEMTIVGEVVAWQSDAVDVGFEVTPAGLDIVGGLDCAAEVVEEDLRCVRGVEYVVARTADGGVGADARVALQQAGFAPIPLPSEIDNIEQAGSLPWVLAAFLGATALAGLLHALVGVVRRRRRDVVIGRALGLSGAGARATTRWSAATMTAIGVAIGVPLGVIAGRLVWASTANGLGAVVDHALPWWAPILVAAAAIVVTLVLAEVPARRGATSRPADILRSE